MSQTLLRVCGNCQTEFEPRKSDQVCCSVQCRKERKRLTERLRQKEIRDRNRCEVSFPCMYKDCSVMVKRGGQVTNKRYCDVHAVQARKDSRKRMNEKRLQKMIAQRGYKCEYCNRPLGKWKKRFCSNEHSSKWRSTQSRRRILTNKIAQHKMWIKKFELELKTLCG